MLRFVITALLAVGSFRTALAGEWIVRVEEGWSFALANTGSGIGLIENSSSRIAATPSGRRMTVASGFEWFDRSRDINLVVRCKIMRDETRHAKNCRNERATIETYDIAIFGGGVELGASKERDLPDGVCFVSFGVAVGSEWFPETRLGEARYVVSFRQEGTLGMRTASVRIVGGIEFLYFGVSTGPNMTFSVGVEMRPFR